MPISFKHKAVFVHIPKTGGQSVSKMLGIPRNSPQNYYWEGLTHLPLKTIKEQVDIEDFYVFTFVRNPYDKILSEYNWRMRNRHAIVYNEPTRNFMEFPQYMETLLSRWNNLSSKWREKAHVMPQHMFLEDDMDVFRYEQFKEGCETLKDMFDIIGPTPKVNVGHYTTKHTERTLEITRMLYEDDFKMLNYDINAYELY